MILRLTSVTTLFSVAWSGVLYPTAKVDARIEIRSLKLSDTVADPGWERRVHVPLAANLVGFQWGGRNAGAVAIRARGPDGWSQWTEARGNPDEGPDPNSQESSFSRISTGPIWVGADVTDIDVRVVEGSLRALRMHVIKSGVSSRSMWSATPALATPSQPPILSRAEWGADESLRKCTPSVAPDVRYAIVHHTATANNYSWDEASAIVRAIYAYHTKVNGFCDIGYNFLVDRFGRIYEGRFGGITRAVVGAHAGGFNAGSTGISLIGNFQEGPVASGAEYALRVLLDWKLTYHGVDAGAGVLVASAGSTRYPAGEVVSLATISGHLDVSATACPGNDLYWLIPRVRSDVQREVLASPPYPLPGWVPQSNVPQLLALDAYGGLHPAGAHEAVPHSAFWPLWAIARGAFYDDSGGYVLDGWGGVHGFGSAPERASGSYWRGWDIARGIARGPIAGSGYVLDGWGGIHAFGNAPAVVPTGYWPGWDIARAVVTNSSGTGGYVLDGWGGLHPFGTAPAVVPTGYWPGWDIARAIALRPDGVSGYVLDGWGELHSFGNAPALSSAHTTPGKDTARGLVLTSDGSGGWVLDSDGYVWPFGNAPALKLSLTFTGTGLGRALVQTPTEALPGT